MIDDVITESSPGSDLFPEYDTLYDLISNEVVGLSDQQLDFRSEQWSWADWSIRVQLSHMASLIYRWVVIRWGDTLFPDGSHGIDNLDLIANSDFDRRMDDNVYHDVSDILKKLEEGIDLVQRILSERNVGFLRSHTLVQDQSPQWALMIKAHPTGITPCREPDKGLMQLEASLRHIYFEEITHLFNIQRLKRAQGVNIKSNLPQVGYWTIDGWDISEA